MYIRYPQTQQQPETPSSDAQLTSKESDSLQPTLDVQLIPEEAGIVLLNPMPLGENRYVAGITVTITVVPQPGWAVEEWLGPVDTILGATICEDGSK